MLSDLLDRLERSEGLGRAAASMAPTVTRLSSARPVKLALSGGWLGHRLHPILTDAVIGAWLSAGILDAVGGRDGREAADRLVRFGLYAAAPTAVTGWSDWADYPGRTRRLGLVHAAANTVAIGFHAASLAARRRNRRGLGSGLSGAGLLALGVGGYLGGHLSYVLGSGVDRTAFQDGPSDWTPVLPVADLATTGRAKVTVDGTDVLVLQRDQGVVAFADTCNHLGCSLARGAFTDGEVTCACHGSTFRLDDGSLVAGPASSPQPTYAARIRGDMVELRR